MKDRILITMALVMAAGPAFAGIPDAIAVPEPGTITLFGTALAGAYIIRKFKGRK
jgi:hypothetical protein